MSTSKLDRLASAAADQLLQVTAAETDTVERRGELDRLRRNRQGARLAAVAAVTVAVLIVVLVQGSFSSSSNPQPMEPAPGLDVGDVPVWYDNEGLHRGDIVEQTAVDLRQVDEPRVDGALALVRTGALYLDPATGDVWFHPWGGEPHIVGNNSKEGPSGDPNGDLAAWFEGSELVVYDTAAGSELSRTQQSQAVWDCDDLCGEHFQGNRFLRVSDERVVWAGGPSGDTTYSFDVNTLTTSQVPHELAFLLGIPAQEAEAYADLEVTRPSSKGNYVLGVGTGKEHVAIIVDTKTGERWLIPKSADPTVAWSYGDIVLVEPQGGTDSGLLACEANRRTCTSLSAQPPILMPTS